MKKIPIVLALVSILALVLGVVSFSPLFAAPLMVGGAAVVPAHMYGGYHMTPGHGWGNGGMYRYGPHRGWRSMPWWSQDDGTSQGGDKTCVWNGFNYRCYDQTPSDVY